MVSVVVSIHLNHMVVPVETTAVLAMAVSRLLVVGNLYYHHHLPTPVGMEVGLPHQPSFLLLAGTYIELKFCIV